MGFVSLFDLFKIGIGPSSSHTVGPMVAAVRFVRRLDHLGVLRDVTKLHVDLYGSLGLTGRGHASDIGILLGLSGEDPDTVQGDYSRITDAIISEKKLILNAEHTINFNLDTDLHFSMTQYLPFHANALKFHATGDDGETLDERTYYSVGGGFVLDEEEAAEETASQQQPRQTNKNVPYPFRTAKQLLDLANNNRICISEIVRHNEAAVHGHGAVEAKIVQLRAVMNDAIQRSIQTEGILPGGLDVPRRARALHASLAKNEAVAQNDPLAALDWINLWAIAVNEENASGGRVVTAPTNGAAGIIPAVLRYYEKYYDATPKGIEAFFLTATAIGSLYKLNASISGAEVGCQGEIGVACSMAAGGLAAALGATNEQIENAAEIGMEHNLGLTCDPVGGLVQIPCIERNAMGAVKAIDASRLAMLGDGTHHISLDKVIETMRRTGADMNAIYKETSQGGLAVSAVEC